MSCLVKFRNLEDTRRSAIFSAKWSPVNDHDRLWAVRYLSSISRFTVPLSSRIISLFVSREFGTRENYRRSLMHTAVNNSFYAIFMPYRLPSRPEIYLKNFYSQNKRWTKENKKGEEAQPSFPFEVLGRWASICVERFCARNKLKSSVIFEWGIYSSFAKMKETNKFRLFVNYDVQRI